MKKQFFLLFLFGLLATAATQAQTRYGQTTFALDTLSATDAMTFTLPGSYGDDKMQDMASWQVRILNLADTLTVNIFVEESIDEDTSPNYVVIDTIVASGQSIGGNTLSYLKHYAIRGKKHRLRVTSTGSSATAAIEVDAWVRNRVAFMLTDEQ